MLFESFPESSQVWVYAADRFLTEQQKAFALSNLKIFLSQWAAHGNELYSDGTILHDTFIVIVANEEKVKSSGCSVDSSVRFIKDLGKEIQVDFFNRLKVVIEKDGEYKHIHYNDRSEYSDWNMFNPMVKSLKELRESWLIPVEV